MLRTADAKMLIPLVLYGVNCSFEVIYVNRNVIEMGRWHAIKREKMEAGKRWGNRDMGTEEQG